MRLGLFEVLDIAADGFSNPGAREKAERSGSNGLGMCVDLCKWLIGRLR